MECYVGLDVHNKASVFVIQDGRGQLLLQLELRRRRSDAGREFCSGDARDLQRPLLLGKKAVDLRFDQLSQTLRHPEADAVEDVCNDLARRSHLIRATGFQQFADGRVSSRYQFVHSLYRDVLYDRLGPARQARLHVRIGERLEALCSEGASDVASELAHHFEAGADWPRTVKYLRLAADASRRRLAKREAVAFLRHALGLVHHLPERDRAATEIALLEDLAPTYIVIYDLNEIDALLESCGALADRAAHYGLVDIELRTLIASVSIVVGQLGALSRGSRTGAARRRAAHRPLGPHESACALRVRAHLGRRMGSAGRGGGLQRPRRARHGGRLRCPRAASQRLQHGSVGVVRYREALGGAAESLALAGELADSGHLVNTFLKSRMIAVWSLTFLGQLGAALHETHATIALLEKNDNHYHTQTAQLFVALARLHARDFAGVLAVCESALPSFAHRARSCERRICLAFAALAETAIGSHASALERLSRARAEMDRYDVVLSWWARLMVEQGFTECFLAMGDLERARSQGARFLDLTLASADRMLRALAWEANARIAMAESDLARAAACVGKAVATIEGFEVPLAAWRVHATAAESADRAGDRCAAKRYRKLSRATILELADTLRAEEPLRSTFLSAPAVRVVLDG